MAYTEQITFLLFLNMAHERIRPPWNHPPIVPEGLDWPSLLTRDGPATATRGGRRGARTTTAVGGERSSMTNW